MKNGLLRGLGVGMIVTCLTLAGCNTVHGFGEDLQGGGRALSDAAKPSQQKSDQTTKQSKKVTQATDR